MNDYLENMKVTIGITCFNAENTISKAIYGAINQDWINKEIIVVDDGSSDSSEKIIKDFKNYHELKFIKNLKNKGTSFSRNKIVNNSSGDVICFMDDDDFSLPNRVSAQMQELENADYPKNKLIACSASMIRKYSSGYERKLTSMGTKGRMPKGYELANFLLIYEKKRKVDYGFGLPTASMLITKECFDKVGLFDENLVRVEDMDLSIRLSFAGVIFVSAKDNLIIQNSNLKEKKATKNFISEKNLIEKYKQYLENKNLYWHCQQWPKLRFFYFQRKYLRLLIALIILMVKNPKRTLIHFSYTGFKRLILDIKLFKYRCF